MMQYNPQRPNWSGKVVCFYPYDMQINSHTAFEFSAPSDEDAIEKARQYGAYKLTRFTKGENGGCSARALPL